MSTAYFSHGFFGGGCLRFAEVTPVKDVNVNAMALDKSIPRSDDGAVLSSSFGLLVARVLAVAVVVVVEAAVVVVVEAGTFSDKATDITEVVVATGNLSNTSDSDIVAVVPLLGPVAIESL